MTKELKRVTLGKEARDAMLEGMRITHEAVSSTLGPRSRNVAIDIAPDQDQPPTILRDGVSVARAINLVEPNQDLGARLLKSAANKTVADVGDATTLTTILTYSIVSKAMDAVSAGANPMQLKQEIEETARLVVRELKKYAKKLTSEEEKVSVATISASSSAIGSLVIQALEKVGNDGVVTVEHGNALETNIDFKQGIEIPQGYISPYFETDKGKKEVVIEDPYIVITDKRLLSPTQIIPIFELVVKEGKSKNVVFIAGEVAEEGIGTLIINHIQKNIKTVAIRAPGFGMERNEELDDIAVLTGGTTIADVSGREMDSIRLEELGRCDKIVVTPDKTTIIGGKGNELDVVRRQDLIRLQIGETSTQYHKELLEQRLGRLTGGVAIIKVGGATDVEVAEKKERVIDALAATRAAIEEGIVAGGEITFYYLASEALKKPQDGFSLGRGILLDSLKEPFKKLLSNSGLEYAEALRYLKKYPIGIDVTDGETKDLIEAGVIDPVKVLRVALENAVSVATLALTTDTLVTWEVPDES